MPPLNELPATVKVRVLLTISTSSAVGAVVEPPPCLIVKSDAAMLAENRVVPTGSVNVTVLPPLVFITTFGVNDVSVLFAATKLPVSEPLGL